MFHSVHVKCKKVKLISLKNTVKSSLANFPPLPLFLPDIKIQFLNSGIHESSKPT